MTKITVFGQEEKKEEKKAIELCYVVNATDRKIVVNSLPSDQNDNLVLLGKSYDGEYDLIMAWDDGDYWKFIYLGHWNDGVVL